MATRDDRNRSLFPRRHLLFLAGTADGSWQVGKNSLAASHARKGEVTGIIFQTSWSQNGLYRAVNLLVSTRRGESAGRHGENALAHFPFLQPYRLGCLHHHLHSDWIFFLEEVETTRSVAGANGASSDFCGDNPPSLAVIFRHSLSKFPARHFSKKRQ